VSTTTRWTASLLLAGLAVVAGCDDDPTGPEPLDPDTAPRAMVDRFSDDAGTLFQRSGNASLPGAGDPIDMDQAPFITQGLGPDGRPVRYYNFDVQATTPAPICVLIDEGTDQPVPDPLNIVDAIPGDPGYNDFWRVVRVTVPEDYVANTATSLADLQAAGYDMETTDILVNCPIVPEGSAAPEGGGAAGLTRGWYEDELVFYFNFGEASLEVTQAGTVPISPIYVTFNINPDQPGGGPPSGFMTEPASVQTHNVVGTVPGDVGYSPLWEVRPYDNASFDQVMDLATAQAAPSFGAAALVNCPVVFEGP
jgi:hypothetical protein